MDLRDFLCAFSDRKKKIAAQFDFNHCVGLAASHPARSGLRPPRYIKGFALLYSWLRSEYFLCYAQKESHQGGWRTLSNLAGVITV